MGTRSTGASAGSGSAAFDPRFNSMLFSLTFLRPGNLSVSRDFTLEVTHGEGQVWLAPAPAEIPALETDLRGTLTIGSECFPRFAPLTLGIRGVDLYFLVREEQLLTWGVGEGSDSFLRLHCTGPFSYPIRTHLRWPPAGNSLTIERVNPLADDPLTMLDLRILKGRIVGMAGSERRDIITNRVLYDRVRVLRADDGELKIRLHAARFELDFWNGYAVGLRVFEGRGPMAEHGIVSVPGGGISLGVSFLHTLP